MQNKQTFTDRLARSYFMLVGIILFLSFLVFYNTLVMRTSEGISNTIYSYAVELSKAKEVQDIFLEGNVNQRQSDYFKDIIEREKYVDYIVLANKESIRLFHPDINLIGEKFMGGDEENALLGKEPYISEEKGTSEYQRRCFSPVFDDNHEVIGFVMVSCYTRRISSMYRDELMRFLVLFILSLLVGWGFSYLYARGLKKRLLGYEPAHIAELFLQREDVLNALNEGLILLDNQGKLVYFNGTAFSLLAAGEAYEEKDMEKMIQETIAEKDYQNSVEQIQLKRNDTTLLMNSGPIFHNEKRIGTLVLINDMTRFQKQAEELTGVKHIMQALRATTHEQKNRLHVILGLLQLGEVEEAMNYITTSVHHDEQNSAILNQIENKTIAALILGKMNRAKELDIDFQLVKGSYLEAHNDYLSTEDLVTIIGNLLENAFDAVKDKEEKKVELTILSSQEGLWIGCDDTGEGIEEEVKEKILQGSYSTKGEGRGTGIQLIRKIVSRCKGDLSIDTELGVGSSFGITIREKRKRQGGKYGESNNC